MDEGVVCFHCLSLSCFNIGMALILALKSNPFVMNDDGDDSSKDDPCWQLPMPVWTEKFKSSTFVFFLYLPHLFFCALSCLPLSPTSLHLFISRYQGIFQHSSFDLLRHGHVFSPKGRGGRWLVCFTRLHSLLGQVQGDGLVLGNEWQHFDRMMDAHAGLRGLRVMGLSLWSVKW